MISVIVYGRNDSHGYNLHRRVALSMNCVAEVLTDPADEIIFVDYNTPDELPTVVEAIADTLTDRCLSLLRVLRVPASLHRERFGGRTHLAVAEPVARNAAARRANPSNRWLLQTTTDMIVVPLQGESLSEVCGDLADGFYGLPRFELPEWVWERLPRADPRRVLAEVERLGPALHLDEPTLSDEWIRFDAPGDFQLVLREDYFAIDGFDEAMLLGWHVDSNLSRRLRLHRGSIETLEGSLAGYHCNHSRIPTVYHGGDRISNELDRFYYSVGGAALPAQRATWGLADAAVEEVPLQRQIGPALVDALLATLPIAIGPRTASDAVKATFGTTYDSSHVLPFIADSLVVSPLTTIGYLGINPILRRLLATLVDELGLGCTIAAAELSDPNDVEELARSADLFVVDLGTDQSLVEASNGARFGDESTHVPAGLDLVFVALDRLVEVERARLALGAHPRRVVLVNSSTVFLDAYVLAQLDCSGTTTHCRVRRATVKALSDDDASKSALLDAGAVARWALGRGGDAESLRLVPGETVRFAHLADYFSLSAGWAFPDEGGVWTWGSRSELSIAFPEVDDRDCPLVFVIDAVCVASDEALSVELLVDGVSVARRDASQTDAPFVWRVELPPPVLSAGSAKLTVTVDEPRSPLAAGWSSDERPLGLHLRSLTLGDLDYSVEPRQPVVFGEGTDGERLLAGGWSLPDATGVWTDGDCARLVLELKAEPQSEAVLVLDVDPFVTPEHAELTVDVWALDTHLARRVFRYDDVEGRLVLRLPPSVRDERGRTVLDFRFEDPARPVDLGVSSDARRLGLYLRSLTLGDLDYSVEPRQPVVFGEGTDGERLLAGGWSLPDATGVWTDGDCARLVLELKAEPQSEAVLVLDVDPFVTPEHAELTVDVWALDTHLARRVFRYDDVEGRLVLRLPPSVRDERGRTVLDFRFEDPARPVDLGVSSDARRLGLYLRSLTLGDLDYSVEPRQPVVFGEGTDGERLLAGGWSLPDATGVWTDGDCARLVLELKAEPQSEAVLVLDVDPFVTPEHAELTVDVWALDTHLARRVFRYDDVEGRLVLRLPPSVRDERGRTVLDFRFEDPARPVDLGVSSDARRLGLHLQSLTLDSRLTVRSGETIELAHLADLSGIGDGWAFCHGEGIWTRGHRSDIALTLEQLSDAEHRLMLAVGGAHPALEGTRTLELLMNGERASVRPLTSSDCAFTWRIDLPADVMADGEAIVTLVTSEFESTIAINSGEDTRERGVRIDAIGLEKVERSLEVGQAVSFIEGSGADRFLGDGWSGLERTGVWTIGQKATLSFQLPADAGTDLELVLDTYANIAPAHPVLEVVFTARNERLGARLFRHGVKHRVVPIPLTGSVVDAQGRVVVDIEIENPVSPEDLGLGSDTRPLGLHLHWLMVRRTGVRGHWATVRHRLQRANPRRLAAKGAALPGRQLARLRPVASRVSD